MKLSEMHPEKMIAASLIERYHDRYRPMSGGPTKLVLDHGLDLSLLKSSVDQSLQKYGSHPWQTADGLSPDGVGQGGDSPPSRRRGSRSAPG
ncbi:MAG: hypothetical protein EOP06_22385, partial [Proteobacteria bacterium]